MIRYHIYKTIINNEFPIRYPIYFIKVEILHAQVASYE